MATVAPSTLTSDIQRSIQQAVNNAHVALNNPGGAVKVKQKKRKRGGEDDQEQSMPADGEATRRKKSKKKKPSPQDDCAPISRDTPNGESSATSEPHRFTKRKKKKGKGSDTEIPIDPALTTNNEGLADLQTVAFLQALVAAVDPTNPQLMPTQVPMDQQLIHPPFDPNAQMMFPGHFMPMVSGLPYPIQPGFVDPAGLVNDVPGRLSLPELASHANEEIIRTLQGVDLAKLQGVLQVLGDAAAAAEQPSDMLHAPPGFQGVVPPPTLPPTKQNPAPSHTILGQPPKSTKPPPPPDWQQFANPVHAELLATKWMNTTKLKEMAQTEGLVYRQGKFSEIEESQLRNAIENYRIRNGLTSEQLNEVIFAKEKTKDKEFWQEITTAVPLRPIVAVYHHVKRAYHPLRGQGKWSGEQDTLLEQTVNDLGQQWEKVSVHVGRTAADCRDRYRNHIQGREQRNTGTWSKEEEAQLTAIVREMVAKQGKDVDSDIFWGVVSQKMGGKRGRQQCRNKWTDSLSNTLKNEGEKPRWTAQDAYILIHKVDSLDVRHDSEIDWKTFPDPDWNLWSPHLLQRRWMTMKRSIKYHENMTHAGVFCLLATQVARVNLCGAVGRNS
ncbi:hypothetical protein BDM02DRAFT_3117798 [Thelephora ganbajun]|uniref:Uncharacterized protein n=1 Tax=Thelephora ganbajun TaxID=370292 RepID=A0ACB6ZBR3_THEGA|nr:hypothetical protein BDM02DRAFT_3117798 [Thelephora ganbajun]